MSRRASLPGASELFRRTSSPALDQTAGGEYAARKPGKSAAGNSAGSAPAGTGGNGAAGGGNAAEGKLGDGESSRAGSGRQKHDSKITVYLSGDELLAMEQTRLTLRAAHELPVDRGRIVREAVAVLLEDFETHGAESVLVRRLRGDENADGAGN